MVHLSIIITIYCIRLFILLITQRPLRFRHTPLHAHDVGPDLQIPIST